MKNPGGHELSPSVRVGAQGRAQARTGARTSISRRAGHSGLGQRLKKTTIFMRVSVGCAMNLVILYLEGGRSTKTIECSLTRNS